MVKKKGSTKSDLLDKSTLPYEEGDTLELDEFWTFVISKAHDYWVWIALCKGTRQVVAYHIGKRGNLDCLEFWRKVPKDYKQSITFSDFWEPYKSIIQPLTQKHMSVGKETGLNNHVERFNNSIRQRIGRLTRKTLSFSKSDEMLEITIRLFIHSYNEEKAKYYLANVV